MKIGIVTDPIDESYGGIAHYTYNLVKNILTVDKENQYVLVHSKKINLDIYKNAKNIVIPSFLPPYIDFMRKLIIFPSLLRKERFDIIHSPVQFGIFLFPTNAKNILTVHDLSSLIFPRMYSSYNFTVHKLIFPRILKNIDIIIVPSESTRNDMIKILGLQKEKIVVINSGVDKRFKPIKDAKEYIRKKYGISKPFILNVNTLDLRKNINTLLKAFYELKKKGLIYKLIIIGKSGDAYKQIISYIQRFNLSNDVTLMGLIDENDIPYFYSAADLFVFPSLYEGFGFPVLEAMACGCPVITSNSSSLPEIVGKAGLMVDPINTKKLAEGMIEMLINKNLRKSMIKRGLKRAKTFSWENTAKETLKIYKEI